jgi:branched-chain amino acid aminotransferase
VILWLNGALIPAAEARIAPDDRGLLLGDGLFETIRVQAGAPRHLAAHLARLRRGAQVIGLPLPALDWPTLDWPAVLADTLAANGLTEGSLRLTVTRGSGPRGLPPPADPRPTVLVTAAPAAPAPPPARLILARTTRRNEFSPLATIKSLNYLDGILARREATERGADDAILLNTRGRAAETTVSTLFVVLGTRILTPSVAEGALPGVARGLLLAHGVAEEAEIPPETLDRADGLILANSLGIRIGASLDGRILGEAPEKLSLFQDILAREYP